MKSSFLMAGAIPLLISLSPVAAEPRWVQADDLRVRSGPGADYRIVGTLSRGTELSFQQTASKEFCLVQGDGQYGYVACQYLSAKPIQPPKAGENGVDAAQRWINGNGVILRDAPRQDGALVGRLSLNATVKRLREAAGTGYCEVQPASGPGGYTACRYLATKPVVMAELRGDRLSGEAPSPDYDPERAFWLKPGWDALTRYVDYLKQSQPDIPQGGPWPRSEALERMKAHLALGLKGPKPVPYPDWSRLKRLADQDWDLSREERGKKITAAQQERIRQMEQTARELESAMGIWDSISEQGGAQRAIALARALELPEVQPSLFRDEAEIAPPGSTTEAASGRFGIVFRQWFTPRRTVGPDQGTPAGLYDMLARKQALTRPVQRAQLFRDGRLQVEKSFVRNDETLYWEVDVMCEGWTPGFSHGDGDAAIWRYFGDKGESRKESLKYNPAGSLFAFYAGIELPPGTAAVTEMPMKLNREATGFVSGVLLRYDLDRDGVADIAVWEGKGYGPGHLEGPTTTDDRWYRLAFANINGAWKVLGADSFSYGCGC